MSVGREVERKGTQVGANEREVGRGFISTQTKQEKGKWATVAWPSTRPDAGYVYINVPSRTQVFYESKVS